MRTKRGFSFIELLIVVAILGALAGMAVPMIRNTAAEMARRAAGKRIASLCRYLNSVSASEHAVIVLSLDQETGAMAARRKGDAARVGSFTPPDNIRVTSDKKLVYFYPDGPCTPFTITVTGRGRVTSIKPGGYGRFTVTES